MKREQPKAPQPSGQSPGMSAQTHRRTPLGAMSFGQAAAALRPGAGESPRLAELKAGVGALLGADLAGVRVHLGSSAPGAHEAEGMARAESVHLGVPEAELDGEAGQLLLAHELAHVVQQRQGGAESDEEANEAEADKTAQAVVRGKKARTSTGAPRGAARWKKKKNYAGLLSPWQEAKAIAYNDKRFATSGTVAIQKRVGAFPDGIFGPQTVEAIAKFQANHGLAADGKVGPITQAAIFAKPANQKPNKPKPKPSGQAGFWTGKAGPGGHLSPAQEKSAIKYNDNRGFSKAQRIKIQTKVMVAQDGDIGPKTVEAIAGWQKAHGLDKDGKVGPMTAKKMGIGKPKGNGGGGALGISTGASNSAKLSYAKKKAKAFGLVITSTTGGKHAPGSYHYVGRAIDVAGSHTAMSNFYKHMKQLKPTELFYDPLGGIKYGQEIGAIGNHLDHVHVAF